MAQERKLWVPKIWAADADLFRAATFVLSDPGPQDGKVDMLYLFGNVPAYEKSILDAAAELYIAGHTNRIGLCGGDTYNPHGTISYSGAPAWRKYLQQAVYEPSIIEIPRPELSHTVTEAQNLLRLANSNGWTKLSITCSAHQQLRGFVLTVSTAIMMGLGQTIRIYNKPGKPFNWFETAAVSQGEQTGIRFQEGLYGEWDRLNRFYGNDGDPLPYEDIVQYLMWRDSE